MRHDIQERCLLRIQARSATGNGFLYVTNHAVAYEVARRGLYLNFVPRSSIKRLDVKSKIFGTTRCSMVWLEEGAEHHFEFRTSQYEQLLSVLEY